MITLSKGADIAIRSLLPEESQAIRNTIQSLENFSGDSSENQRIKKLRPDNVYIMEAPNKFKIFFQILDKNKEILGIAREEALETFQRLWRQNERIHTA